MNRPRSLTCFLCGQGFGTASLAIHQPQCYKKKIAQWEVGDLRTRGPRPVDPSSRAVLNLKGGRATAADVDRFNEQQYSGYVESLSPCPHCGRRFNPQSLQVHLRSCRPGNTAKPLRSGLAEEADISGSSGRFAEPPDAATETFGLIPCRKCSRRFAPDRIAIHENACLSMKARKKFNSSKQRAEGTEISCCARRSRDAPVKPPSKWRQEHQEFMQAIRYSRIASKAQASGKSLAHLPPPPPSTNPDYLQCPYCQRRFNPKAAERHIPSCANTINKPKPPPQGPDSPSCGLFISAPGTTRPISNPNDPRLALPVSPSTLRCPIANEAGGLPSVPLSVVTGGSPYLPGSDLEFPLSHNAKQESQQDNWCFGAWVGLLPREAHLNHCGRRYHHVLPLPQCRS